MTTREQFDTIADSIRNGQRRQAVAQMDELGMSDIPDMLDYFVTDLCDQDLALDAAKSWFRIKAR